MSGLISCTVRCKKCDSSIGLSVSRHISVVYSDVSEDEWHCNIVNKLNWGSSNGISIHIYFSQISLSTEEY